MAEATSCRRCPYGAAAGSSMRWPGMSGPCSMAVDPETKLGGGARCYGTLGVKAAVPWPSGSAAAALGVYSSRRQRPGSSGPFGTVVDSQERYNGGAAPPRLL